MFKPFDFDALNGVTPLPLNEAVSFTRDAVDITQVASLSFMPAAFSADIALAPAPLLIQGDMITLIAQAAITALIDNGHFFTMDNDGCGCCGHDHGNNEKQQIIELAATLQSAIDSGLIAPTLADLIGMSVEETGGDPEVILEAVKDMSDTASAEVPTISYMDSVPGSSATTATLAIGGTVAGTRETGTDADWYQVDLVAGQAYTFIMLRDGANPHTDPLMSLIGTDGTTVLVTNDDIDSNGDGAGDNQNSIIEFTATTTGTYYISAEGWTTTTGDYTIYAEEGTNRPDFTLDQSAFFLTDQFSVGRSWGDLNLTYDVSGITAGAQNLAILAMQAWADVSGLTFTAVTAGQTADITFNEDRTSDDESTPDIDESGNAQAFASSAFNSNGEITSVTVTVSDNWDTSYDLNSYRYQTYLHEVGHALGLGHGGPYNGNASYATNRAYNQDAWNYTVMSYFDQGEASNGTPRLVLGPQMVDIIAIQNLYGTNPNGTFSGDTVYGFNSNAGGVFDFENTFFANGIRPPSLAIFDSNGIDTLDMSGFSANQTINLNQETFSSVGDNTNTSIPTDALVNNLSVARGADIENAIGGSGNDTLLGNGLNNTLTGNGGNDTINGGGGDDTAVYSGLQSQYTVTDNGDGTLTVQGSEGTDTLSGIEFLKFSDVTVAAGTTSGPVFTEGDDEENGTEGDDVLNGLGGDDEIDGLGGNDTITGGLGDDYLNGGSGVNTLTLNEGEDVVEVTLTDNGTNIVTDYDHWNDEIIFEGVAGLTAAGIGASYNAANNTTTFFYGSSLTIIDGFHTTGHVLYEISGPNGSAGGDIIDSDNDIAENLLGNAGNDVIISDDAGDYLFGGAGDDRLVGGQELQFLIGGTGDDRHYTGEAIGTDRGVDAHYTGEGRDSVIIDVLNWGVDYIYDYEDGNDKIIFAAETGLTSSTQLGFAYDGPQNVTTVFYGSSQIFIFTQIEQSDLLIERQGDDVNNTIFGDNGGDYVLGNGGDDILSTYNGDDWLNGGIGNDVLYGGGGNDRVEGGFGDDLLYGGADTDTFVFGADWGADTILDFNALEGDTLLFDGIAGLTSASQLGLSYDTASDTTLVFYGSDTVLVNGLVTVDDIDVDLFV
ncbi:M10 family metallopeptidase C-terminal domain-containing protein [Litorimonas sp. RW-G-Af-16]|uniref:M10 family metallopeptidase C-terminal domain-containing protein n=1 Tax=Litorimonas sp. RW-G-Af-16 TaxID=3241168 RepID=UPI00390CB596